jgi:uncharacterized protein
VAMRRVIEQRLRRNELTFVELAGVGNCEWWAQPEAFEFAAGPGEDLVHILSPFDPLIRQRKRRHLLFDYKQLFEAHAPRESRQFGYFSQPVLIGDEVTAVLDLKVDRDRQKLLVQRWTWFGSRSCRVRKKLIEVALHRFERLQLAP